MNWTIFKTKSRLPRYHRKDIFFYRSRESFSRVGMCTFDPKTENSGRVLTKKNVKKKTTQKKKKKKGR